MAIKERQSSLIMRRNAEKLEDKIYNKLKSYSQNMKKLTPLYENIIVEPLEEEAVTKSGIVASTSKDEGSIRRGTIISIPKDIDSPPLTKGAIVLFSADEDKKTKSNEKTVYILDAVCILAIEETTK